jgi:hypothetical protein
MAKIMILDGATPMDRQVGALFPKGENPSREPPVCIRHTSNAVMNLARPIDRNNDVVDVFGDVEGVPFQG